MIRRGVVSRQSSAVSEGRLDGRWVHRCLRTGCLLAAVMLAGCRQDMHNQPKYQPFEESDFFADGQANRMQVAGTVARGQLREDRVFFEGLDADGALVTSLPIDLDETTLERGREVARRKLNFCLLHHWQVRIVEGVGEEFDHLVL